MICGHSADKSLVSGSTYFVSCRTCGDYRIGIGAEAHLLQMPQERKWLLTALVRAAHERDEQLLLKGNAPYELTKDLSFPDPPERAMRLLRYLDASSGPKREPVELDAERDYPVAFAAGPEDFRFLVQSLIDRKLMERAGPSARLFYRVTMAGYEQLKRAPAPAQPAPATPAPPPVAPLSASATTSRHSTITLAEQLVAQDEPKECDVFLSHASEDKATVTDPLYGLLVADGLRVWYDKAELTMGDSLRRKIDEGLRVSRFGVVILSPAFFAKNWPQHELDGLAARELAEGRKVILPVWHNVTHADVLRFSAPLADKKAANTKEGLEDVAQMILGALKPAGSGAAAPASPVGLAGPGESTDPRERARNGKRRVAAIVWLRENRQWVFSGIGVFVLALMVTAAGRLLQSVGRGRDGGVINVVRPNPAATGPPTSPSPSPTVASSPLPPKGAPSPSRPRTGRRRSPEDPYFAFERVGFEDLKGGPGQPTHKAVLTIKNVGRHPAASFSSRITLLSADDLRRAPNVIDIPSPNDIAPDGFYRLRWDITPQSATVGPFFVVLALAYSDPWNPPAGVFAQRWYFRWSGFTDGRPNTVFTDMSPAESAALEKAVSPSSLAAQHGQ